MKTLVVYSSRTGNTEKVARAVAEGLHDCDVYAVKDAPNPSGYDFVAVGYWVDKGMLPLCPARLPRAAGMPMRHNLGSAALFHRQLAKDDRLMIPRRAARAILQAKPSTDEATVDHATPA